LGNNEGDRDSKQIGNKDPNGNPSESKTATKSSGEDNGAADEKATEAPSSGSTVDNKGGELQDTGLKIFSSVL